MTDDLGALLTDIGAAHFVSSRDRYDHVLLCAGEIVAATPTTDDIVAELLELRRQAIRRAKEKMIPTMIEGEA